VLNSMLEQKLPPGFQVHVVMHVPYSSFREGKNIEYVDPTFLYNTYSRKQITIHRPPVDHGPSTKFLGLVSFPWKSLPFSITDIFSIWIADDDIIYRNFVFGHVLSLVSTTVHPDQPLYFPLTRMVVANCMEFTPYRPYNNVMGFAGIMLPMSFVLFLEKFSKWHPELVYFTPVKDSDGIRQGCRWVDDIVLSFLIHVYQKYPHYYNYYRPSDGKIPPIPPIDIPPIPHIDIPTDLFHSGLHPMDEVMDQKSTDEHPNWFELGKNTERTRLNASCDHFLLQELKRLRPLFLEPRGTISIPSL